MKKLLIYISIGLVVMSALAAELMSFYKSKFSGINNRVNVRLLQDDESPDMANFNLDEVGSIKERDLFGQYNSLSGSLGSNSINGLFKFYTTDSKFLIACAGTNIGLGSGGAFTSLTPSNNTVTAGSYFSGVTFNNKFYLFNPTSEPLTYTGSGSFHKLENSSAIPGTNCSFSAIHKARVWAARSDSFPYRLYYSSVDNAENWTNTGGFLDLPDLTQSITGLISWGGYLYIFTETNIYILLGSTPNDFSLRKTNSMVGAIAPRSIKITDIGACFLARSGVYAFDGNNSNKISDKINTTITGISKTLIQNAAAIYDGQRYWFSYTPQGSSYNNRIMIYDILLKDWYMYQGDSCNISYFERAYGGTDKGELYGGSSNTNGLVYQLQSSTGTESINHSTQSDFNNGSTFNTVVTQRPHVALNSLAYQFDDTDQKLYVHFDGSSGQTSYTAETGQSLAFNGNAQLNTSQRRYGLSSLSLDGTGDYISISDSSDWDFTTGNFTIDFWLRPLSSTNADGIIGTGTLASGKGWVIELRTSAAIRLNDDTLTTFVQSADNSVILNEWHHYAVVRNGNTIQWYVDGRASGSSLDATGKSYNANDGFVLGRYYTGTDSFYYSGQIDELRISKGIARWTSNFDIYELTNGTLASQNVQINAAGTSTLGAIAWSGTIPTNTQIAFQTRTGTTNDSVAFSGWQYWSSANTVTLSTVTDSTTNFSPAGRITVQKPSNSQARNILYYEDEDNTSPNCAQFQVYGAVSTNAYATGFLTHTDLSNYNWLTIWYKSPATGNSVEFYMGNNENNVSNNYVTFNTVSANTWEKAYWYIGNMQNTDKNGIKYIRAKYKGDASGYIYLGDVSATNYYDSGDTMTSSANDWIQYRSILGSGGYSLSPRLSSIALIYSPSLTTQESSLSSYYYTKWFDFQTPQINKQFDSLVLEVNSTTANTVTGSSALCTINCDYDIDFGTKTGTMSFIPTTTANTVRLLKNFPSSTYGKSMRFKIYNDNKDAQVTVKGLEVRYRPEKVQPD